MRRLFPIICLVTVLLGGCENALNIIESNNIQLSNSLSINVLTDVYKTKSVNLSNELSNGSSIGLFMKNVNASDMVQYDIRNVKFTASVTEEGQDWLSDQTIYLNQSLCNVYAYYPHNEAVTDIEAVSVEVDSQTDYLFAGNSIQVNCESRQATLEMKHALSVITLNIKKGSYDGVGEVTKVGLRGSGIAHTAKLNGKTGDLNDIAGVDEMITQNLTLTLDETGQTIHTLFVPNAQNSNVKISLWVDGNEYYAITPGTLFKQGYRYEYTLTVDEGSLDLSAVHVGDWGYDKLGSPVLWAGNYRVSLQGDLEKLAIKNTVENGIVTIEAKPLANLWVPTEITATDGSTFTKTIHEEDGSMYLSIEHITKDIILTLRGYAVTFTGEYSDIAFCNGLASDGTLTIKASSTEGYIVDNVSYSGTATFSQSFDYHTRTIYLTDINSDITLQFDGIDRNPPAIAEDWNNLPDGVYLVRTDLKPANIVDIDRQNQCAIGVGLVNAETGQKLMIEKQGESNPLYQLASTGKASSEKFYWGGYNVDQSEIDNITTSSEAYADFNGATWSNALLDISSGGFNDFGNEMTEYTTIGTVLKTFRSTMHLGFSDWYIPSVGHLFLIYQNLSAINSALVSIGGTQIQTEYYWSSSESDEDFVWDLYMGNGQPFSGHNKVGKYPLRLVRDL